MWLPLQNQMGHDFLGIKYHHRAFGKILTLIQRDRKVEQRGRKKNVTERKN